MLAGLTTVEGTRLCLHSGDLPWEKNTSEAENLGQSRTNLCWPAIDGVGRPPLVGLASIRSR